MKNFIGKVASLVGLIANIVLFIVTIVSIIFTVINDQILNLITNYVGSPIFWLGTIFSCIVIIYSFVLAILTIVRLVKGNSLKIIGYNLISVFVFLLVSGIVVFGFAGLSELTFDLYLGLYISYCVINTFFLTGIFLNYK